MDLGLRDRVFLVTAASSGLGGATARQLVAEGAKVVLVARRQDALGGPIAIAHAPTPIEREDGRIGQVERVRQRAPFVLHGGVPRCQHDQRLEVVAHVPKCEQSDSIRFS